MKYNQMRMGSRKIITYIISLVYISISIGAVHYGDFVIKNSILSFVVMIILLPGGIISIMFGILGGTIGEIIGIVITVILTIYFIERFFKRRKLREIEKLN